MRTTIRLVASLQVALIFPAILFLTAVLVGAGDPPQYELARAAQAIVTWYAARMWTLWLLLLILPLAVLAAGCVALLGSWNRAVEPPIARRRAVALLPAPVATFFVAGTTFTSAGILVVVVLHMLAN
jgi:hypothetical protein